MQQDLPTGRPPIYRRVPREFPGTRNRPCCVRRFPLQPESGHFPLRPRERTSPDGPDHWASRQRSHDSIIPKLGTPTSGHPASSRWAIHRTVLEWFLEARVRTSFPGHRVESSVPIGIGPSLTGDLPFGPKRIFPRLRKLVHCGPGQTGRTTFATCQGTSDHGTRWLPWHPEGRKSL